MKKEEAGFFSLINETITNDDINFTDFIVIFKVISNEILIEEDTTNALREAFLEGGYELKEIKYQYINKLKKIEDNNITFEGEKLNEKNNLINSLSQLQTLQNDLIICCLTPVLPYFKNSQNQDFNNFWEKKIQNKKSDEIFSMLLLIYYSNTKIRGLYDSQYMFPNLFKVKHIFQLIISKSEKENINFDKHLSQYQNCLSFNSFHVAHMKKFEKLSQIQEELEYNLKIISNNQGSFFNLSENFQTLKNFYLNNEKFKNFSCALSHLTYIGNNDCLKRFSSEISFNNNFFIINYDEENECDELIKIFMELPEEINYYYKSYDISLFQPKNFSSYQRIMILFKPFICRNNLNDILLNVFKVNNFNVLTRKLLVLSDENSNYLYHHECPDESVSFKNYYHMMSDSNCEVILLSKFRGFSEAHAILGSNSSVLTSNKGQSNNNFLNIYSLINSEISKLLKRSEINNINFDFSRDNKNIERDFLDFSSKINLYFYLNDDMQINEEEINYFCPEFCYMQDLILICKSYSKRLEDIIISFKYEILDLCSYRFEEYEIDKIFKGIYEDNDPNNNFDLLKEFFKNHDICLMRIVKPGSFLEFNNILFDKNKFLKSFNVENFDSTINQNYFVDKYEFIRNNCFLMTQLEMIEYLYPIINEQIYKIEGNILINNEDSPQKTTQILNILKHCLKCTIGEDLRSSNESFTGDNDSIIHRYMQFYHQDFIEESKKQGANKYFMNCINNYFNNYCKMVYNKKIGSRLISQYYSEISDNNISTFREILSNNFSFLVESNNLGFYEIRIPIMDCFTKQGWTFIESDKYLLSKFYIYSENEFYKDLALKNQDKNILVYELPFDGLLSNYNFKNNIDNASINNKTNRELNDIELILNKYLGTTYKYKSLTHDNSEEIKNIVRYIIFKTKYESNKVFNKKCILTNFKKTIVPRNYHYRMEPNKIYMNINRIYEVEEFTGLSFIEMVIQDYMKYRPNELNKTFDDLTSGRILRRKYDYRNRFEEKQYPLTPLLWGRKLNKICKIIEDQKNNLDLCDNYGPIIYVPIEKKLSGIIDKGFIQEYEIYLYLNLFEDIKTFIHENEYEFDQLVDEYNKEINRSKSMTFNGIEIKEVSELEQIIEKKLYEVFNSEIFKKTRNNYENIKLLPNRIEPNNVRINKSLNSKERIEEKDQFETYKNIASINLDYEKTYHDTFKKNETHTRIDFEIINKNISLTDIFCYNGMKYHMFAAFYFLINIIYKKINRQTQLISIYFDKNNKNYTEINEEYDIIIDSIMKGFLSKSYINYKEYNDSNRYNAYLIEYFFYCLKEIKHYINEIKYLEEKINKINIAIQSKYGGKFDNGLYDEYNEVIRNDYEQYSELKNLRENMEKVKQGNISIINIIFNELLICPLQQSEEELSNYKNIWAPKERYYIPMFLNEKWERNLDNDKYKRLEKVDDLLLNKLNNLKGENEREIFTNAGYEISNGYYLIEKNMLREPDPPISDKILLEKKKFDKSSLENKIFSNFLDKELNLGTNTINNNNSINNKTGKNDLIKSKIIRGSQIYFNKKK